MKRNLIKELEICINEYDRWVHKNILPREDWEEEMENMSFLRAEIHKLLEQLEMHKEIKVLESRIRILDQQWQTWILENTPKKYAFKIAHPRNDQPKKYWWEWIDQLDSLNDSDLKTL